MKLLRHLRLVIAVFFSFSLTAQVTLPSSDVSDWMKVGQEYYRCDISEDGIYKIDYNLLISILGDVDHIVGSDIAMYSNGSQVRIWVTTDSMLSNQDYILFFAEKNRGDVDALLYNRPEDQLNPRHSLYADERAYYLTIEKGAKARYIPRPNGIVNTGLPIREDYYIHHETIEFNNFHFKPTHNGRDFIRYSTMDVAEGFGSTLEHDRTLDIPVNDLSPFGANPRVEIRFGTNVVSRQWQVSMNDWVIANVSSPSYGVVTIQPSINKELLREGYARLRIRSLNDSNERHSLAYVTLKYPRQYDFQRKAAFVYHQQGSIIPRLIEIKNFSGNRPVLINLTKGWIMSPEAAFGTIRYVSPEGFEEWQWAIADMIQGVKSIQRFTKTSRPVLPQANYWILTGNQLAQSHAVTSYADYRRSTEGGAFHVAVVNVDEWYDAFSFGVKGHPLAVKNLLASATKAGQDPEHIFIIGKGREYPDQRNIREKSVVPTFGAPGSDQMLVSHSNRQENRFAIGRLAANTPKEVAEYLDKIKLQENPKSVNQTLEDLAWRKTVLHLSGGSADIQNLIFGYLNNMQKVISTNHFGGEVKTFRKTSADPIQKSRSEEIMQVINQGVSLLTFFGHSAVGTFDFSLEKPSEYDNQGSNPVILSLGCHSGNIYTPTPGISEEFVLSPRSGAIAFVASSGTAYIEPQYQLGKRLYDMLGTDAYGYTIGQVNRMVLEEFKDNSTISYLTLRQQLTLHGDPAYRLSSFQGPDLTVDPASVRIKPDIIDQSTETIDFSFDVVNLGASIQKELEIQLFYRLEDGTIIDTIDIKIATPSFKETVHVSLPQPSTHQVGLNNISILLDPSNKIAEAPTEQAESNNILITDGERIGFDFYIYDNGAKPVYPTDFSIINDEVILYASIANAMLPGGEFIFQIDTTETFDSPFLAEEIQYSHQSIISWRPPVEWQEARVYYWRVAPMGIVDRKSFQWRSQSFLYLPSSTEGWNQSHYFQWQKNQFYKMHLDTSRAFDLDNRIWDIRIKNKLRDIQDFWVFVNNTAWSSLNPKELAPALSIFIWHPESFIFQNSGTDFGSMRYSKDGFVYRMDRRADRVNVKRLLEAAPEGARVFIHTTLADDQSNLYVQDWIADKAVLGYDLFEVLESYGAKKIRGMQFRGTVPYTFIFDKGVGPVVEDLAQNIYETIDISSKAEGKWESGTMKSTPFVGSQYKLLEWSETKAIEDSTWIEIHGLRTNGKTEIIRKVKDQYIVDLASINASQYRQLWLEYHAKDELHKSSSQLDFWRVTLSSLPDAALLIAEGDDIVKDTLDEGETLLLNYKIKNLINVSMEPLLVRYKLTGDDGTSRTILKRTVALKGNEEIIVAHEISTDGLGGKYRLSLEINADQEQAEITDCNNRGIGTIFIVPDSRNPILDVTFDGKRIADGHTFFQAPIIHVHLRDPFSKSLLTNPNDFDIRIHYPGGLLYRPKVGLKNVEFIPANDLNNNIASFILTPNLHYIGEYVLEVQAKDIAGNHSGANTYKLSFKIAKGSDDVLFRAFPNPASDYIEFEYFLPNERIPTVFNLQIYAADGRLVNVAYAEDFGGIEKGVNRYRWNLRDQSGVKVPVGIYFYRLINDIDTKDEAKRGSLLINEP